MKRKGTDDWDWKDIPAPEIKKPEPKPEPDPNEGVIWLSPAQAGVISTSTLIQQGGWTYSRKAPTYGTAQVDPADYYAFPPEPPEDCACGHVGHPNGKCSVFSCGCTKQHTRAKHQRSNWKRRKKRKKKRPKKVKFNEEERTIEVHLPNVKISAEQLHKYLKEEWKLDD